MDDKKRQEVFEIIKRLNLDNEKQKKTNEILLRLKSEELEKQSELKKQLELLKNPSVIVDNTQTVNEENRQLQSDNKIKKGKFSKKNKFPKEKLKKKKKDKSEKLRDKKQTSNNLLLDICLVAITFVLIGIQIYIIIVK